MCWVLFWVSLAKDLPISWLLSFFCVCVFLSTCSCAFSHVCGVLCACACRGQLWIFLRSHSWRGEGCLPLTWSSLTRLAGLTREFPHSHPILPPPTPPHPTPPPPLLQELSVCLPTGHSSGLCVHGF